MPQAGYYAGDYGATYPGHRRVEVLMVRYEQVTPELAARWGLTAGSTWLLGQKVTGDQHVPQGEVSFRVPLQGSTGESLLRRSQTDDGVIGWLGEGCLARPGFRGHSYVQGVLLSWPDGRVSFQWDRSQDSVVYEMLDF